MTPTESPKILTLPPALICAIIEACGKSRVRSFKYGDLQMEFGNAPEVVVSEYPMVELPRGVPTTPSPDHVRQNKEALERDEQEVRAEQLALMAIEDPMEYERQLKAGELLDEPNGAVVD